MDNITVIDLLKKYKIWMENDEIQFLKKGSFDYKSIAGSIDELIAAFDKAARLKNGDLSSNLDWHKTHELGGDLWKILMSACLKYIDPNAKGNSQLYDYIKNATEFEDLLYGLEDFYRDHTLHSLWVYFIGEYIMREKLHKYQDNLNWYVFNDIKDEKDKLFSDAEEKVSKIHEKVSEKRDAIWCVIALCHDLGYSISKLTELNKKVKGVLEFFDLDNVSLIGYVLKIEHQYNISQFLELIAIDVRVVADKHEKETQIKCFRDDSTYWRLCRALEKQRHGILSAYLIYKLLGIFADSWVSGTSEELDVEEAYDNVLRGDILFAIAQHDFDFAYLNSLGSLADILIISDELEEFSRFGRQLLTRKYHETMANSQIEFETNKKEVAITFIYEVAEHRDLGDFFRRKAERLAQVYTLNDKSDISPNSYEVTKIIMKAKKDKSVFEIKMTKTGVHKAELPEYKQYKKGQYEFECKDDKISIPIYDEKPVELEKWMNNFDEQSRGKI